MMTPAIHIGRGAAGQSATGNAGRPFERRYQYDADGHLTRQGVKNGTGWLFDTRYQYDVSGNLYHSSRRVRSARASTSIHPLSQLLQHTDPQGKLERFFQDPGWGSLADAGTRDERRVECAKASTLGRVVIGFDRVSQLTRREGEGHTLLTWDARQRLVVNLRRPRHRPHATATTRWAARVWKQTGATITHFQWDGNALPSRTRSAVYGSSCITPALFEPAALVDRRKPSVLLFERPERLSDARACIASGESRLGRALYAVGRSLGCHQRRVVQSATPAGAVRRTPKFGLHYNRHRYYDDGCDRCREASATARSFQKCQNTNSTDRLLATLLYGNAIAISTPSAYIPHLTAPSGCDAVSAGARRMRAAAYVY